MQLKLAKEVLVQTSQKFVMRFAWGSSHVVIDFQQTTTILCTLL